MIGRIVFVMCIAALIIGIKAKPMHNGVMSANKNVARPSIEENKNDDSYEYDFYTLEETHNRQHNAKQMLREQAQKEQLKFIKSKDHKDYAFDTIDTDQFSEDDDMLRRYYAPVRRSANNDYDSFSDFMRSAAAESNREDRFIKRLHYGDDDSFLNDAVDENSSENKGSAESYDDYDY